MDQPSPNCSKLARTLGDLSAQLPLTATADAWQQVEQSAQALANELRVKDAIVDNHTALGKTLLPTTLSTLIKLTITDPAQADTHRVAATYELLRVGANLCVDHDLNREQLLESGYVQSVVSLLERYVEGIPDSFKDSSPLPLSIPHLKVVKTAIGVLLNCSIGYEPVRVRLISLEAPQTLLRLSSAIYPPGQWLTHDGPLSSEDNDNAESINESWSLRSGLSGWAWRAIGELKGEDDDDEPRTSAEPPRPLFGPDALPLLVRPLHAFVPPYPTPVARFSEHKARASLLHADFHALEEACSVLEGLCLDVEDARLALARGLSFPDGEHGGVRCLEEMLSFIERGDHPPFWEDEPANERAKREKAFAFCKAAVIKAVVEVSGEEKNTDVLWDDSEPETPGGAFVWRMATWLKTHGDLKTTGRDDLVICATLSLGNIVRREAHSIAIAKAPISVARDLVPLLSPETDIKVMHGVLALLKHLAQSTPNRAPLGKAGVIDRLATCQIWADKADMAELVQVSAIGIAKHLCNGNVENVFALVIPAEGADGSSTALSQILALARRSDSVAVKSEGTRVLVNAIRTLWSSDANSGERRKQAMLALLIPATASALAQLVARSRKYPLLINEGVMALTLLSTHTLGGPLVIDALMEPLPRETNPRGAPSAGSTSTEGSPVVGAPARALDTLLSALRNRDGRLQPEIRANICALIGQLGKPGVVGPDREAELLRFKDATKPLLETASVTTNNTASGTAQPGEQAKNQTVVANAAKRALEAWGAQ